MYLYPPPKKGHHFIVKVYKESTYIQGGFKWERTVLG